MTTRSNLFSPEVHARVIRMVFDHRGEHGSQMGSCVVVTGARDPSPRAQGRAAGKGGCRAVRGDIRGSYDDAWSGTIDGLLKAEVIRPCGR